VGKRIHLSTLPCGSCCGDVTSLGYGISFWVLSLSKDYTFPVNNFIYCVYFQVEVFLGPGPEANQTQTQMDPTTTIP
jgi:hypothetical protein